MGGMYQRADIRIPTEWLLILTNEINAKNVKEMVFVSDSGNILLAKRVRIWNEKDGRMTDSWDFTYNPED